MLLYSISNCAQNYYCLCKAQHLDTERQRSACQVLLKLGSLRQNPLALSLSFLRGSWDRVRQKLSFAISELLAHLQETAFCNAELLHGKFHDTCLQLRCRARAIGVGSAGFGAWGGQSWQHTKGWLRNCSAGTNRVQPDEEEAEKLTLQVCRILRPQVSPGTRVFQPPLSPLEGLRGHCLWDSPTLFPLTTYCYFSSCCFIFLVNCFFFTYICLQLSLFIGAKGGVKIKKGGNSF